MSNETIEKSTSAFLVTRTLSVPSMYSIDCERTIQSSLNGIDGVLAVETDLKRKNVWIKYYSSITGFSAIEKVLQEIAYPLANTPWTKFLYGWFRFTDENEYANARAPISSCCSNPKDIYAKRHK